MGITIMSLCAGMMLFAGAQTNPPLHEAARKGSLEEVAKLIESGADVNGRDAHGSTALHYAGDKAIAELLLSHSADIGARNNDGWTPLFPAVGFESKAKSHAAMGKIGTAKKLDGPSEAPTPTDGRSVREEVAAVLIAKGADVNARDRDGWTPLHWAQSRAVAEMLIDHGAGVNTADDDGHTPLHAAGAFGQSDIVELLLSKGADVKAVDYMGMTPLFGASLAGDIKAAGLMIAKGADVNAKDNAGYTPLRWAEQRGGPDMVAFLKRHGAR